jgi:protein SCO1/2
MLAVLLAMLYPVTAEAQRTEPAPTGMQDVGVTEKLDAQVPPGLPFVDTRERDVTLGDFFDGNRPVVLTLNYSNCPMLCSMQLNGLFDGLEDLEWSLGENFQMVTISIDPKESPIRARQTKQKYLRAYGRPGVGDGWHLLTGDEENIKRVADSVGFRYKYLPDSGEFSHVAAIMILTPDGRVSKYLYGIEYPAQTLRLALVEAADGKIGTPVDQLLLFCFRYDAAKGRYGPAAVRLVQIGGTLTAVLLFGVIAAFWRREVKKGKPSQQAEVTG